VHPERRSSGIERELLEAAIVRARELAGWLGEHMIKTDQWLAAELGDPEQCLRVAGQSGETDRVRNGDLNMVSQLVQPGRQLPRCEPRRPQ
jgi:hypothetical protein